MKIVIPIPPVSKGRPVFANGHAYTPSKTREYEQIVQLYARRQIKRPLTGAVKLSIQFYLPIPKSWPETKKQAAMDGQIVPTTKPDVDNLLKAIMDALNGGIGYNDDKQVVEIIAEKQYSDNPRTEIELEEL